MESCSFCGESYLTNKVKIGEFCSKSCSKQDKNNPSFKHGHYINGKYSITYNSWQSMKQRCLNPNHKSYEYYKKFLIYDGWLESFENFFVDMGERPSKEYTLDRKDNTKGYYKENCRWATKTEQSRNRDFIKLDDKKVKRIRWLLEVNRHTQQQIADMFDVNRSMISHIKHNKTWKNIVLDKRIWS